MLYHAQIFGIKNKSSAFVFIDRQIFSRPFFLHHRIIPTAGMCTGPMVCIPSGKITAEQASARIGNAHGSVDKAFDFQLFRYLTPYFPNFLQRQFPGGNNPFRPLAVPEQERLIICVICLCGNMNINFRADLSGQHKHSGICYNQRIRLQFLQFPEIFPRPAQITVMRQYIRRHMHFDAMGMGKAYPFRHIRSAEVLCFGSQPKCLTADIYGICTEHYGSLQHFQAACRNK